MIWRSCDILWCFYAYEWFFVIFSSAMTNKSQKPEIVLTRVEKKPKDMCNWKEYGTETYAIVITPRLMHSVRIYFRYSRFIAIFSVHIFPDTMFEDLHKKKKSHDQNEKKKLCNNMYVDSNRFFWFPIYLLIVYYYFYFHYK